jgi:hypothetical protein
MKSMNQNHRPRNAPFTIYGILAVVLFTLGVIGFARHTAWHQLPLKPLDWAYLTIQLIPMNSGAVEPPVPPELEAARFLIPLLAAIAAVQAFFRIFREQIHGIRLPWLRKHIIICGLSRKGFLLASQFREQGHAVVVIERDEENDWLESCRGQGMFLLMGEASDPALLNMAGVARAEALFAVCDNDGANAEIALRVQELARARPGEPLVCLLHVTDPQLCNLLREQETGLEDAHFRLELFNVFERAARRMLQKFPAWDEAQGFTNGAPHILIIGLGRMGENLTLHTARDWWNLRPRRTGRLRISIIDRHAVQKIESLGIRYPQISQAADLIALEMEVHSPEFERANFLFNDQKLPDLNTVYICVDDDTLGLHAGLTLLRQIPQSNIPIVVRMAEESGLARLLESHRNQRGSYRNLFSFGYLEHTCTPELLSSTPRDMLARAAHAEYVREQTKTGAISAEDPSLQPWDTLDEQYRRGNYHWADHIPLLLKTAGYQLGPLVDWDAPSMTFTSDELVERLARLEHDLWRQDKVADGWRYTPGTKNLTEKTNPALVSWDELTEEEQAKNRMLVKGIPAFLGQAGFQLIPVQDP